MCLTIPGKIKSIRDGVAVVENGTRAEQIELGIVLDAKVGDWVLYATNRAVRRIDAKEAREIIELLEDNYQPVDIAALPLRYKQVIYKVRHNRIDKDSSQISKQNQNSHPEGPRDLQNNSEDSSQNAQNDKTKKVVIPAEAGIQNVSHGSPIGSGMTKSDLEYLLNLRGTNNLEALYSEANVLRKEVLEDFVCIHGIVEFSNYCRNNCLYCGIRRDANIQRYRMTTEEIYRAVKLAVEKEGYKLVVLQSGEDYLYSDDEMVKMINRIKKDIRVFIFISVGERSRDFYERAFKAGATGSLFRFETSNPELYKTMHPGHNLDERLECLKDQIKIGYYVASGGLIGLPGQTVNDMAEDLLLVQKLGIPMLSSGPWIKSAQSPLSINSKKQDTRYKQITNLKSQIPNSNGTMEQWNNEERLRLTLNYYAAARLLMPGIKIPVTTALETLDPESGRHKGLLAGANALMFNITPEKYRADYNLYDHKYIEREKVWQKYGLFKGEESYEMLEERLMI